MESTFKTIIQKYVILKIDSGEWEEERAIPSENALAAKFGCSRLTARTALQALVHSGILHVRVGSGYTVPTAGENSSITSFTKIWKATHSKVEIIDIDNSIYQYFEWESNDNVRCIKKTYYNNKDRVAFQITFLNKDLIWELDVLMLEKSITKFLSSNGNAIKNSDTILKVADKDWKFINDEAKRLGWKQEPIVEIVRSYTSIGWIEKTVRVTSPEYFKIKFTKKNFTS